MEIKLFLDQISAKVPLFERLRYCVDLVLVKYILVEFNEQDVSSNYFPKLCDTLPNSPALEVKNDSVLSAELIATCTLGIADYLRQFTDEIKFSDIRGKISKRTANARCAINNGKFEQFKSSLLKMGQKLDLWSFDV